MELAKNTRFYWELDLFRFVSVECVRCTKNLEITANSSYIQANRRYLE